MTSKRIHIGVDVSKDKLDYFAPGARRAKTVANRPSAIRSLVALAGQNGWSVCCEATAIYPDFPYSRVKPMSFLRFCS